MLEAMICKVLVIIKVENETHERILNHMGYERGIHYVGVDSLEEILPSFKSLCIKDKETMIEKAHLHTLENHTYEQRAKQLIALYEDYMKEIRGDQKKE
jgi:hypothetical protein